MASNGAEDGLTRRTVAVHIATCLFIFALCLWRATATCNGWLVTSSGAAIVVLGVLMEYLPILTTKNAGDLEFWQSQRGHDANRLGIGIVVFGTLVWAFGDCLLRLTGSCTRDGGCLF
jgi:hypothetical protein